MFSIRENLVREKQAVAPGLVIAKSSHHQGVSTMTDDSSLFLLHRMRDQRLLGAKPPKRWRFWRS